MLRAAIVEKSKEHREYIRAGLQGLNMEMQVSEFSNEYDYLENVGEEARIPRDTMQKRFLYLLPATCSIPLISVNCTTVSAFSIRKQAKSDGLR